MKHLILFVFLFISQTAAAYIPPYWMIMSKTSDNHGTGLYLIEQDVIFETAAEPLILTERWIIANETSMRLEVIGRRQLKEVPRLTFIYQNNRRYYVDENGVKKFTKISDDFFEPYFHYRLSKNIKPLLVAMNIAPSISLKSDSHKYSTKNPQPPSEPYVRLSRTGGVITYAIGTPTPASSTEGYPGLWIEQDQFVIRRLRLPTQLEIVANDYKTFANGLKLPQERLINWKTYSAKINLSSVKSISATKAVKESLDHSSLKFGENPNLSLRLTNDEVIKNFYSYLR